jgi:tRNA1(Val) A37 N6-methylase TrmN6
MAGLFSPMLNCPCRLLDPGAGIGSLSSAFLDRCQSGDLAFSEITVTAFELDNLLQHELTHTLSSHATEVSLKYEVLGGDFIEQAVNRIQFGQCDFTHAILNPPYKKINSDSHHRLLLRQVGIETVNLYSAFLALTVALLAPGGQLVAIIPRSFCNGPYYRPFRDFLLERTAIRHLHPFDSRNKQFKDDAVLQENIILVLERGVRQGEVTVSTSTDDSFIDLKINTHPFDRIVFPGDAARFIHVPATSERSSVERSGAICHSLDDLGVNVSTGPVVDFRLKEHLRHLPEPGAVPLLYPAHFRCLMTQWPQPGLNKANAIRRNPETEKWLYPVGCYCVVRRFSAKEDKRRVVAGVVNPDAFDGSEVLGFENHLNVFHQYKQGLPVALAHGLAVFLSTTAVDENFRRFSGHTQVNATDLKLMKYPSREALIALGAWAIEQNCELTQAMIDNKFEVFLA